jgi:hypothetical protein
MIVSFILRFNSLPPQIPLFYSLAWGEEQLADLGMIFLLPILMDSCLLINHYLGKKYFSSHPFVLKIFYYVNIFLVIVFTAIFLKIIFLIS